jgi:hypothetical protein
MIRANRLAWLLLYAIGVPAWWHDSCIGGLAWLLLRAFINTRGLWWGNSGVK